MFAKLPAPEMLVDAILRRYDISHAELRSKPHIVSAVMQETITDSHQAGLDLGETLPVVIERMFDPA